MRRLLASALTVLFASCTLPTVVATLEDQSPPAGLGRAGWVRATSHAGSWIGGAVGAIASIVVLPISWPIAQLADEPLGYDKEEFTWGLVSIGASSGHYLLGAPFDGLDWVFRRAWTEDAADPAYQHEIQPAPVGPAEPTDSER